MTSNDSRGYRSIDRRERDTGASDGPPGSTRSGGCAVGSRGSDAAGSTCRDRFIQGRNPRGEAVRSRCDEPRGGAPGGQISRGVCETPRALHPGTRYLRRRRTHLATVAEDVPRRAASDRLIPRIQRGGRDHPRGPGQCGWTPDVTSDFGEWLRSSPDHPAGRASGAHLLEQWRGRGDLLTATEARELAAAMDTAAFCFEPDVRFSGHVLRPADAVVFYPCDERPAAPSEAYLAAATIARLGVIVASADGAVVSEEQTLLRERTSKAIDLTPVESRRLEAYVEWLLDTPIALDALEDEGIGLNDKDRIRIIRFLVAVAGADGYISRARALDARRYLQPLWCYHRSTRRRGRLVRGVARLHSSVDSPSAHGE